MTPGNTVILAKKVKVNRGTYLPGCRAYLVEVFPTENRWLVELSPTVRVKVPATSLRPEATCVYCGCTDSKACPGGCTWVELHQHTPTGVCSGCTEHVKGKHVLELGVFTIIKPGFRKGTIWLERAAGEGMNTSEAKLAAAIEKYFNREF